MEIDTAMLDLLAQNRLLRGLPARELAALAVRLRREEHGTGAFVTREGEPADRVCLLVEGSLEVLKAVSAGEQARIGTLAAGDFFGENSIVLGTGNRTLSARATGAAVLYSIAREDFDALLDAHPLLLRNILANVIGQLRLMDTAWVEALQSDKQQLEEKVQARTRELEAVNQRIGKELVLAQIIQRNLLPEKRTEFPGVTLHCEYIPCDELGGDITGAFRIDETRVAVYGGDVCGHGIYAAMVMSYVKKLIETSVKRILLNRQYVVKPPGAVLTTINRSFIAEISQGDPEIYLTLFLGVLDAASLGFEFSSAGTHVPPLVLSGGKVTELFDRSDFPLGHVPDHEYETRSVTFARGDELLFVSDGVVEATREGIQFGMDRLKSEVLRVALARGGLDLDEILACLHAHLGGEPPQDDMCLMAMKFAGWKPPAESAGDAAAGKPGGIDIR